MNALKQALLEAGDIHGLLELNRSIFGGARMAKGYNASSDVLTMSADGRDLNDIWTEFQETIALANERRQPLLNLLTFDVTNPIEDVTQFGTEDFEEASEYGVPKAVRPESSTLSMGYTFKWYDVAARYTWMFLAEATAQRVEAVHQTILDADNRLLFREIMRALFRNTQLSASMKNQNYNVYPFWNGDGTVPPSYKGNTFDGSHTHYRISGAASLTSGDLDEIEDDFKAHGYGPSTGTTMMVLLNVQEANIARTFRVSTGSRYDFIPAANSSPLILPVTDQIVGSRPGGSFGGLTVVGQYGNLLLIEEEYVPAGYVVGLVSGGEQDIRNPIGLRQHAQPGLRGLRLVKGPNNDYPLIESEYVRGFGTGVRQRGAGIVMKIAASGSYAPPALYT